MYFTLRHRVHGMGVEVSSKHANQAPPQAQRQHAQPPRHPRQQGVVRGDALQAALAVAVGVHCAAGGTGQKMYP